jgi:hypothetical protein
MNKGLGMGMLLTVLALGVAMPQANASNLDTYRNLLIKGTYMIKYDNITPLPRVTNKDKINFYGYSGMAIDKNDYLTNRQISGVLVSDGNNRYEEVGDANYNMCRLMRDKKSYSYSKYVKNNAWEFFGSKKGVVSPVKSNVIAELTAGESYGDADMSKVLSAMLPAYMQSADATQFEYVTSGWLDNGLNYEDYQSVSTDNGMEAIRYYFNGYNLVKIAYAGSFKDANGKESGRKCIIKIKEFSPTPEKELLKLPSELKSDEKNKEESDDDE